MLRRMVHRVLILSLLLVWDTSPAQVQTGPVPPHPSTAETVGTSTTTPQTPHATTVLSKQAPLHWNREIIEENAFDAGSHVLDAAGAVYVAYQQGQRNRSSGLRYAQQVGADWQIEAVTENRGYGGTAWLALDGPGSPHISHMDCNPWSCDYYHTQQVEDDWTTQRLGIANRPVLDSNGHPHIAGNVGNVTGQIDLGYVHWSDGKWITGTVDSGSDPGYGQPSLDLDSQDRPHIAYHYGSSSDQGGMVKYARWTGSEWVYETVDDDGLPETFREATELVLDSQGLPHMAYKEHDELRYAWRSPSGWKTEFIADGQRAWSQISMALDSADRPHVVYANGDPLWYAYRMDGEWHHFEVDTGNYYMQSPSLTLDAYDRPHVVYERDDALVHAVAEPGLSLTAHPPHVALGAPYTYSLAYRHLGASTPVTITANMPESTSVRSTEGPGSVRVQDQLVAWQVPVVPLTPSTLTIQIAGGDQSGLHSTTATATIGGADILTASASVMIYTNQVHLPWIE